MTVLLLTPTWCPAPRPKLFRLRRGFGGASAELRQNFEVFVEFGVGVAAVGSCGCTALASNCAWMLDAGQLTEDAKEGAAVSEKQKDTNQRCGGSACAPSDPRDRLRM